jgi:single-strand DNA-binding protein
MRDINKVILVGRLGVDPVMRQTKSGLGVVHFSLATSRKVSKQSAEEGVSSEYQEETQWHRIVVWGKQGESCFHYLKKGDPIYLEGSIRSHYYEDKNKVNRTSYEIHADGVSFLSNPRKGAFEVEGISEVSEDIQNAEFKVS